MKHAFEGQFDLVISALSIHHQDEENKRVLYRKIYDLLVPGGEFLNADQIISPFPILQGKYLALWMESAIENGFTEAEIERTKRSISLDDPSTIENQLAWMTDAGFSIADCVHKYMNFAVLYAKK
jgi:tRNA (cmo5U34)-methyltransferase